MGISSSFISYLQNVVSVMASENTQQHDPQAVEASSVDSYEGAPLSSLDLCKNEDRFCRDIARWSGKKSIDAEVFMNKTYYRMRSLESLEIENNQLIVTIDGKQESVDLPPLVNGERIGTYPRKIVSDPQIILLNNEAQSKAIYYEYDDSYGNNCAVILVPVRHKRENGWQVLGVDLDGSQAPGLFYRYSLEQIIKETLGIS